MGAGCYEGNLEIVAKVQKDGEKKITKVAPIKSKLGNNVFNSREQIAQDIG